MINQKLLSFHILGQYPDFLDLPWSVPLSEWNENTEKVRDFDIGLHRHVVKIIEYESKNYAFKEVPTLVAEHEFNMLRRLNSQDLPSVTPVGFVKLLKNGEEVSLIITEYLEGSIPFRSIFTEQGLTRYQEKLLNAVAVLLVHLHLGGFFWGDCSLSNILFKRDVGELQAYFVDAETTKFVKPISDGGREHDLQIMEENISGDFMDLSTIVTLPNSVNIYETPQKIRELYYCLWKEVMHEEVISSNERYKIHERINRLNELGFSVDEFELVPVEDGNKLRIKTIVTEKYYHKKLLFSLTGLHAEETQARLIICDINEFKNSLSTERKKTLKLKTAAHYWLENVYYNTLRLAGLDESVLEGPQIYCQILQHKWFISEKQESDVGIMRAIEDYLSLTDKTEEDTLKKLLLE